MARTLWQAVTPDPQYASSVPKDCGPNAATEFPQYRNTLGPASKWQCRQD